MPVLTVCNHKGGTGKTTTSIHLAAALALQGRRVLVVDFDPQGFLTRMLGAAEPRPEASALGLLGAEADLRSFPTQRAGGFDLIASSMGLTKALRSLTKPTDVLWLRETFRAGHDYDVILVDTAAALSPYTMNALVASDLVVIPVTPEYQPVVGAEQTWQTVGLVRDKLNPGLAAPRMLLTQVDARLNRHAKYADYLREKYADGVLNTPIRTSSSLAAASRDGQTVFDIQPGARGALDYQASAQEVAALLFRDETGPSAQATSVGDGQTGGAPAPDAPAASPAVGDSASSVGGASPAQSAVGGTVSAASVPGPGNSSPTSNGVADSGGAPATDYSATPAASAPTASNNASADSNAASASDDVASDGDGASAASAPTMTEWRPLDQL